MMKFSEINYKRNYKIFLKWIHRMKRCCSKFESCFLLILHRQQYQKKKVKDVLFKKKKIPRSLPEFIAEFIAASHLR